MKRVYASADPVQCGWLESILGAAGIDCLVRNRYLGGAIGELPINESWPEIWVLDEADVPRAQAAINKALEPAPPATAWQCGGCAEHIEGQFQQCWNCGLQRPAEITS